MKKFKFALDTVLSYKQQVLDALKGEHAAILTQVREQERLACRTDSRIQFAREGMVIGL